MTGSKLIDLRSDTVTQPTSAMRRAMLEAPVGDDVYGEDPTVNELEVRVAALLGKEAAVFVPSGTMGNLIAVLSHCGRGDEMLLGDQAHIYFYEQGGSAAVGGVHPRAVPTQPDGTLTLADLELRIRGEDEHFPVTRLIALENTHNRCGGRVLGPDYVDAVGALAAKHGLALHVDGARLWNAAVALGEPVARLVQTADSVSVCFSKGLGAPVGSAVVGSTTFIKRARRMRKQVGGGMRQAGVIAAAALIALDEMIDRLAEDHARAKTLAAGLDAINGVQVDVDAVETNIVFFDLDPAALSAAALSGQLAAQGIRINPTGPQRLRAVTNYHISDADVERTLESIWSIIGAGTPRE